jgi:hypothetical protein
MLLFPGLLVSLYWSCRCSLPLGGTLARHIAARRKTHHHHSSIACVATGPLPLTTSTTHRCKLVNRFQILHDDSMHVDLDKSNAICFTFDMAF